MLLSLDHAIVAGRLVPFWLGAGHESFVASILDAAAGYAGLAVDAADGAARAELRTLADAAGVPAGVADALWVMERRRRRARVAAPVPPDEVRDVLFELAARLPRSEAVDETARQLGLPASVVLGSLFADRPSRRVLDAAPERVSPAEALARYNQYVVDSLLARSTEVRLSFAAPAAEGAAAEGPAARGGRSGSASGFSGRAGAGERGAILSALKREGLAARIDVDGRSTQIELVGPLGVARDAVRYGRRLARYVSGALAAPAWSLSALVRRPDGLVRFALDSAEAVPLPPPPVPREAGGRAARRVERALRTVGVLLDPDPAPLRVGNSFLVPDFALEWSSRRVDVDVLGHATRASLDRERELVRRLGRPMLICVEHADLTAALVGETARVPVLEPWVVPYRGDVDPWALWTAAARLLGALGVSFDLTNDAIAE